MTDEELVRKRLALIETLLRELATLTNWERLESDVRELRFVEHTLQIAIQAALDVTSHIVSEDRLGEPKTNRALFAMLVAGAWVDPPLGLALERMAGFRNVLVHGYTEVDTAIVRDAAENRVADLAAFVTAIRKRLS